MSACSAAISSLSAPHRLGIKRRTQDICESNENEGKRIFACSFGRWNAGRTHTLSGKSKGKHRYRTGSNAFPHKTISTIYRDSRRKRGRERMFPIPFHFRHFVIIFSFSHRAVYYRLLLSIYYGPTDSSGAHRIPLHPLFLCFSLQDFFND